MTYKELHDLIPEVVGTNSHQLVKAEQHAYALREAADNDNDRMEADKLFSMIDNRREQLQRMMKGIQNSIHQMALLSHSTEGFEVPEEE